MRRSSGWFVLAIIFIIALGFVLFGWAPSVATFKLETAETIVKTLLGLLVAALFMERAQEVFITAWRQGNRDALEARIASADAPGAAQSIKDAKQQLIEDLANYRARTRVIAVGLGVGIGLLFALSGIRTLSQIVNHENLVGFQETLFYTFDIFLTAGVIAGGSEGLHKFISVFTDAFDATRDRLKTGSPTP